MSKKRDETLFISDILESANAILKYVENMDVAVFINDRKTYRSFIGVLARSKRLM